MKLPALSTLILGAVLNVQAHAASTNFEFISYYLNSFASRDAAGLYNLFNWDGVESGLRKEVEKELRAAFKGQQIRRIYIDPVRKDLPHPTFEENGKQYELNLKPTGQLYIVYMDKNGATNTSKMYVGKQNGQIKIGSLRPVTATASN
ncbi:hypothetical protein [Neptuniibacter sp. CAU 1671]|uniref:hypothetical protein n=1 Tax=Neptuniibacter sp. CAU 1671 TaxID=3032593 RepID=UPI0023D9B8C4|nr:hypothetical protein [Neptuniibacter sp. CAU 1671]MDF2182239.1 hypothetical protein [Neptuniibacter sp. CAU 1671]